MTRTSGSTHSTRAKLAYRIAFLAAHRVIGVADAVRDWLVASSEVPAAKALRIYNPAELPRAHGPEIVGEIADLLVRGDTIDVVFCGTFYHGNLILSVRTERADPIGKARLAFHRAQGRASGELDGWLVGTTYDARRRITRVNVLEASRVSAGPVAQAALPYWLPLGFHGNFSAA